MAKRGRKKDGFQFKTNIPMEEAVVKYNVSEIMFLREYYKNSQFSDLGSVLVDIEILKVEGQQKYKSHLEERLGYFEGCISDINHHVAHVEEQSVEVLTLLKECLLNRRAYKDSLAFLEYNKNNIVNYLRVADSIKTTIKYKEERCYTTKHLIEQFGEIISAK